MKQIISIIILAFFFSTSCDNDETKTVTPDRNSFPDTETAIKSDNAVSDQDLYADQDRDDSQSDNLQDTDKPDNPDSEDPDETDEDNTVPDSDIEPQNLSNHAGFVTIEPFDYTLGSNSYRSGKTRMWYSLQLADESPEDKPVFIFFNGGPGSSTGTLLSFNTGRKTLDPTIAGQTDVADNPHSWTQLGNLIHVDARQTGFSYSMVDNVSDLNTRNAEYSLKNFNSYLDASDFIRTLLAIFERFPELQDNRVVIVGESWGGTRAENMIHQILFYDNYKNGKALYQDIDLAARLDRHYKEVFPEQSEDVTPPEVIARQFSHVVMIQPLVAGGDQFDIGREMTAGLSGGDPYCLNKPEGWLMSHVDEAEAKLLDPPVINKLLDFDISTIDELYAENRTNAFRYGSNFSGANTTYFEGLIMPEKMLRQTSRKPRTLQDFENSFGLLESWDDYYVGLNRTVNLLFNRNGELFSQQYGQHFLESLPYIEMMITNAANDIVIYSPSIPPALESYSIVSSVVQDGETVTVNYSEPVGGKRSASFYFPYYADGCHAVTVTNPAEIFNHVKDWMNSSK